MAKAPAGEKFAAVKAGYAHRLLPAVLQRMQAKGAGSSGISGADDAKNAAFLAQLVAIGIEGEMFGRGHPQGAALFMM